MALLYHYLQGTNDPSRDMRCLMLDDSMPRKREHILHVDGTPMAFLLLPDGTEVSMHIFQTPLGLTRIAGTLWLLHELW